MDNLKDSKDSIVKYIIGASRVKYDVLFDIYHGIDLSPYRMAVMYIDAYSIFSRLYRYSNISNIYQGDLDELVKDLVVGFMNVLGHYRRFMATRLGLSNDIYVFFNKYQPSYHKSLIESYGYSLEKRYSVNDVEYGFINQGIEKAYPFIMQLSTYYEGIYCINNQRIDSFAAMKHIGFKDDIFYTILTRNNYALQMLKDNVVMLYENRNKSFILNTKNAYSDGIQHKRRYKPKNELTVDLLPLIWTFSGMKSMDVPRIVYSNTEKTMVKHIDDMFGSGDVIPNISFDSFLEVYAQYIPLGNLRMQVDYPVLFKRYMAFNVDYACKALTNNEKMRIERNIIDLFDEEELENINQMLADQSIDPYLIDSENLYMSAPPEYDI